MDLCNKNVWRWLSSIVNSALSYLLWLGLSLLFLWVRLSVCFNMGRPKHLLLMLWLGLSNSFQVRVCYLSLAVGSRAKRCTCHHFKHVCLVSYDEHKQHFRICREASICGKINHRPMSPTWDHGDVMAAREVIYLTGMPVKRIYCRDKRPTWDEW